MENLTYIILTFVVIEQIENNEVILQSFECQLKLFQVNVFLGFIAYLCTSQMVYWLLFTLLDVSVQVSIHFVKNVEITIYSSNILIILHQFYFELSKRATMASKYSFFLSGI